MARQRSFGQLFAEHKTGLQMDLAGGKEDKENRQQNENKQVRKVTKSIFQMIRPNHELFFLLND